MVIDWTRSVEHLMRWMAGLVVTLMAALPVVSAQEAPAADPPGDRAPSAVERPQTPPNVEELVLHGEFAVLLLKVVWSDGPLPPADEALQRVQELELVPRDWGVFGFLTHGELADVLEKLGVMTGIPVEEDTYATRPYVEAVLRRDLAQLRDYMAKRMGHGFSLSHVMDEGVDRAVSASSFQ